MSTSYSELLVVPCPLHKLVEAAATVQLEREASMNPI